jgi:hypothetical protein
VKATEKIDRLFRDAFEDVALMIGGAATAHRLRDDLVHALVRRLTAVRKRTLARLRSELGRTPAVPSPCHPAVEQFIVDNRERLRPAESAADSRRGTTRCTTSRYSSNS